jgi:hypothetical protein
MMDYLSKLGSALKNAELRIIPVTENQAEFVLGPRAVRLIVLAHRPLFLSEFWSDWVLVAKLQHDQFDRILHTAKAWLRERTTLEDLARIETRVVPTDEGVALEQGRLRELRWEKLVRDAPPMMKDLARTIFSNVKIRSTYPLFKLNRLALLPTAEANQEIASVRPARNQQYEVLDARGCSLGVGSLEWVTTILADVAPP